MATSLLVVSYSSWATEFMVTSENIYLSNSYKMCGVLFLVNDLIFSK